MGFGGRRPIFIGLMLIFVLGIAVYLRLWTIDYSVSSEDQELLRRQFDLANKEAMDESAEWRSRYDEEVQRANMCVRELMEVKEALRNKVEEPTSINKKLDLLQKENIALLDRVESLKQELETEKLKCSA